jgi:hypothetical protein
VENGERFTSVARKKVDAREGFKEKLDGKNSPPRARTVVFEENNPVVAMS